MLRIFLIADDGQERAAIVNALDRADFAVDASGAGLRAYKDLLRSHAAGDPPALILIDGDLSKVSGYDLTQTIKSDATLQNIPLILLSADVLGRGMSTALEMGPDDVCLKPISFEILIFKVKKLLKLVA